jgi:hypothetical protein|tara:strand:- start:895 stop:2832 length:1938 start_codon:yes stop_codon:yes gene_type:complete
MNRTHWVMDYETMTNLFVGVFQCYGSKETKVFKIHSSLYNDIEPLVKFLQRNKNLKEKHISFNGINFDSQITEFILKNQVKLLKADASDIVDAIYAEAQETISRSNAREFSKYPEWKLSIEQIDVFKINHWDNNNKRTSLKWAQFAMDWPNLQDMPIHHAERVHTEEEIQMITDYCINDVESTKKILHLSKPLIAVRKQIKEKYGLECYNYSNTKIGSQLLLGLYCEATDKKKYDVKDLRTFRDGIPINDILFDYIEFKTPPFQQFLKKLKDKTIYNTKSDFKYKLRFKGYEFHYGAGGIHQCINPGKYLAEGDIIIKDLDVASLYPSIACVNNMYPAHLGPEFFQVYKNEIVDVRLAEKKKPKANRDIAIIEGFKEAANASYGNSNSEYSWLYDPKYTMQTTINGQLLVSMLVEDLLINIPESVLLQTNTDGATMQFDKKYLDKYDEICKEWEKKTKLILEYADYSAMYIWDVNNYISLYTDGNTKCKGRFEWEDLQNYKYSHLHKNKSHLVVAKAIYNYFINGIEPTEYIKSNTNIFDYCAGVKIKGDWSFYESSIKDGQHVENKLQKTIRYYISNKGSKILKINNSDNRQIQVEAGKWMQNVFNTYIEKPFEEYDINYDYYLESIMKEIKILEPKNQQLKLF